MFFALTSSTARSKKARVMSRNALVLLASAIALVAETGCTHVAAYERAKLAHPTMVASEMAGPGDSHVHAVLEGATGGSMAVESGCGCN